MKSGKGTDMAVTDDPGDPRLTHGVDEERAKGFVRPVRRSYLHLICGTETRMGLALAETYARQPTMYGATYCVSCQMHRPVGKDGEFIWIDDHMKVGT